MWAQREKRGPVAFWVHVHADKPGETFDQRKAVGMARSEARKWAAELGMTTSGSVSSGGEYGPRWRHSLCFMFQKDSRTADPVEEDAPECEGHYDDDRALLLGKPYYCDGKCL